MLSLEFWVRSFPYPFRHSATFRWLSVRAQAWQFSLAVLKTSSLSWVLSLVSCPGLGFNVLLGDSLKLWPLSSCLVLSLWVASEFLTCTCTRFPLLSSLLRVLPQYLLTGLLHMTCSACFLILPRTTCLGVGPLSVNHQSRKYPTDWPTDDDLSEVFSQLKIFPDDFSLY